MIKVGQIQSLWRYPVKGMSGESLSACHIDENGIEGDRLWCVRDVMRQEIQSCKFRPALLSCIAQFRQAADASVHSPVDILFPDGTRLGSDDPNINTQISDLLGHDSTIEPQRSIQELDFYRRHKKDDHTWLTELKATFEREAGEALPDLDNLPQSAQDFVSLPGTFFLVSPLHLVTTATLAQLKSDYGDGDWEVSRFRPNLVIETLPELTGLVEQDWLGKQLVIGNTRIDCNGTTPRCGAVAKSQQGMKQDNQILRTIVQKADQNLGIYGETLKAGDIQVGDEVYLIDA